MVTIQRFEEIEAWQQARKLTQEIYKLSGKGDFTKDFGLRDQIRKAAVSVMSNIAEGFERGGSKEFHQFLAIAKGSVGEIEAQFYVALDQGYINNRQFDHCSTITTSTKKLIAGFMNYLKTSPLKGQKYQKRSDHPRTPQNP